MSIKQRHLHQSDRGRLKKPSKARHKSIAGHFYSHQLTLHAKRKYLYFEYFIVIIG